MIVVVPCESVIVAVKVLGLVSPWLELDVELGTRGVKSLGVSDGRGSFPVAVSVKTDTGLSREVVDPLAVV